MFRPSQHGWPFGNVHACAGAELGTGGPPPPELGLGGGMCWAALDRYLRGVAVPRDTAAPAEGDPLHTELVDRQVAAVAGLWPRIREWQAAPDGSWRDRLPISIPGGGDDVASRTRTAWRAVRRSLKEGRPVLLTLLPDVGPYDRPRAVRQVLATGWSRSGRSVIVSIYDPDRPDDDDVTLRFDVAGELDARTAGVAIRGFFPVEYDRAPIPMIRTESFADRSVIGLHRAVRGRPGPAAGRRHIALVARNERGALLHFHRKDGKHWEGTNVTEVHNFGAHELHSDPVALSRKGTLHVFGRSYVGDLLYFRHRRGWSVTNCTEQKRVGARFRLAGMPVPVAAPRFGLSVLGRDENGGLVHYRRAPFRGWRAEQVPGDPVASDPVAARTGDALHVVATAPDGRLLHWSLEEEWRMTDPDAGDGAAVRLTGRPSLLLVDGRPHVVGRDRDRRLALLHLADDGGWATTILAEHLAGDPETTHGPAGLHVFAPTDGGLVHAWRADGGWTSEDVVTSRPTLPAARPGTDVAVWGSETALRAFVRHGPELRAYSWTPDADWVVDPVTPRAGDPPIAFRDGKGRFHLALTDGRGTIMHVETGPWREPGHRPGDDRKQRPGLAARDALRQHDAAEPGPQAEPEPLPELQPEPVEPAATAAEAGAAEAGEPAAAGAEPEEVLDFATERMAAGIDPARIETGEEEPAEQVAGIDRLSDAGEEPEPETAAEAREPRKPQVPEDEEDPEEWEPFISFVDEEPEEPREPEQPAETGVAAEAEAPSVGEGRWEEEEPGSPDDEDRMDLSLLDTWPAKKERAARPDDGSEA